MVCQGQGYACFEGFLLLFLLLLLNVDCCGAVCIPPHTCFSGLAKEEGR